MRRTFVSASLAALLGSPAFGAPADDPILAVAARLQTEDGGVSLAFDLTGSVAVSAHALTNPKRIVIDLPAVDFHLDPALGRDAGPRGEGIVKSFRFGLFGPGKSRIVVDLGETACIRSLTDSPLSKAAAATRLKLLLAPCSDDEFAASVQSAPAEPPPSDSVAAAADAWPDGPPAIVLDPGHGGVDGGAYGLGGATEKVITLDFAEALAERLRASGRYRVVMTRESDAFVSLEDRVQIAEQAKASLFVSIHADTLQEATDVSGATVYTNADRPTDAEAARIADRENAADKAAGADEKAQAIDVADILFDLKRRETRAYAHIFSRDIVEMWKKSARLNRNPERAAGFYVLKAPDFPSVLIELGYLSNTQDVQAMNSPQWRAKSADAVAAAIDAFFARSGAGASPGLDAASPDRDDKKGLASAVVPVDQGPGPRP